MSRPVVPDRKSVVGQCPIHDRPLHPGATGCLSCLRESQLAIPKKQHGRPQVGVACRDGASCQNLAQCQTIYTQDFLHPDGSCPNFQAKSLGECVNKTYKFMKR
ncbi:MAG: hypothetical protein HQL67_02150 [Magnetococcales bacterium]|nr:hypothetical protein [Magnetococcales bacterium]